jgi:hypothetical protein
MGHHYILHALPLLIAAGMAGWVVYFSARRKLWAGGLLLLGLAANSAWALWLSPAGVWPNDNGTPGLFSAARPPVVRPDYDEWMRLADYLQRTAKPDDRIMMVGSSFIFNQDLLRAVYTDILGTPDMFLRFARAGEIDHEEPAPFDAFASANIYLVPTPPQYHLDPAGQRVVTAAANRFPPASDRAALFHADDDVFHMADGVTVKVWRRGAWTPALLHETLNEIRRDGPQDPNTMQDWAAVTLPLRAQIRTDAGHLTSVDGLLAPESPEMSLFFDMPLAAGANRVGFVFNSDCPGPKFQLALLDGGGHAVAAKDFAAVLVPGEIFQPFEVPEEAGDYYVQLGVSAAPASLCRVRLRELRTERM